MNTAENNIDADEIAKFDALASRWWDPEGDFRPLHEINPLRLDYIRQRATLKGSRVLDVGCGTGDLLIQAAPKIKMGVGLDLDTKMIDFANQQCRSQC